MIGEVVIDSLETVELGDARTNDRTRTVHARVPGTVHLRTLG